MKKIHIKKNDTVKVLSGEDRVNPGKGKVLKVFPKEGTALVENVNFVKKHTRANPQKNIKGGILERESPVKISKLQVICPECSKPTRIGSKELEDGRKVRICKKCDGVVDR